MAETKYYVGFNLVKGIGSAACGPSSITSAIWRRPGTPPLTSLRRPAWTGDPWRTC